MSESVAPVIVKGHCPNCGPKRNADVRGEFVESGNDDCHGIWFETSYRILRCRGCDKVYFQTDAVCSEDFDYITNPHTGEEEMELRHHFEYWPKASTREPPEWSRALYDKSRYLKSLFDDIYIALNHDLAVFTAIGIRTAFDLAAELLDIDPSITFKEKLEALVQQGNIGRAEQETLDTLTDAGSAAAHRGWQPDKEELSVMMGIFEQFIHRNFILDDAAKHLKKSVPEKKKREKRKL